MSEFRVGGVNRSDWNRLLAAADMRAKEVRVLREKGAMGLAGGGEGGPSSAEMRAWGTTGQTIPVNVVSIILLGDSAVGKSKLIERFLLNDYVPHQLSTYALTLYRYKAKHPNDPDVPVTVEFWDTAGQERFQSMHPSYYLSAHCCILCFDMTRKVTYKNLDTWYDELVAHRGTSSIPVVVIANKVDMDPDVAKKSFGFVERRRRERAEAAAAAAASAAKYGERERGAVGSVASLASLGKEEEDMPLFLCSASDGTNVVSAFREAIRRAVRFKEEGCGRRAGSSSSSSGQAGACDGGAEGGLFVDDVLDFLREEEARPDGGLFRRMEPQAAV
ncbi:P-loop containing nucleoside triphosphate hydrolase protein [Zopfochytrium polystomum]|nr:P-loop containing nucleoside triphosphate hydrolase protein [Zopfochytrium polystomum]